MPIDLVLPRDSIIPERKAALAEALTSCLLHWTDASDDAAIRANVGVYVHELDAASVNAGGRPAHIARIDVKVPQIALSTQERRAGFTADATAMVRNAARPEHPFDHVWLIITHATEGGWGIDGRALTTADME